jgi:diaminopimelate decarboxylase
VRDIKTIGGMRFLICDGGRTNHALESDWMHHEVLHLDSAIGDPDVEATVICGPTCMAYDWLYRGDFSSEVKLGDRLVYLNAGAYHVPWETHFSHGLARVIFTQDGINFEEIRAPESQQQWLSRWSSAAVC